MEKLSLLKRSTVRKENCFPAREKLNSLLFKVHRTEDRLQNRRSHTLPDTHTQGRISGTQATDWSLSLAVLPPGVLSSGWDTVWRNLPALRMPRPCIRVWHSWNLLRESIAYLGVRHPDLLIWVVSCGSRPQLWRGRHQIQVCVFSCHLFFFNLLCFLPCFSGMSWASENSSANPSPEPCWPVASHHKGEVPYPFFCDESLKTHAC